MADPYAVSKNVLRTAMYIQHGPEFEGVIIAVVVMYATSIILNISTIALRWKGGNFWMFRIHTTPGGEFITPNPVANWIVWMLFFYVFALYFAYRTWESGIEETDMSDYIFWLMTVWLGIWSAGWLWAWSTALAPFLSPKGSPGQHRLDKRISPALLTGFFITVHVLSVTAILILAALANIKFNTLFQLFKQMDQALTAASEAYQAGQFNLLPSSATLAAAQAVFNTTFEQLTNRWIAIWTGWLVIDSIFIVIFVFAMWAQYRDLSEAIANVKLLRLGTASWDTKASRHMENLVWSVRSLQITGAAVVLILLSFIGLQLPCIDRTTTIKALQGETLSEILRLAGLSFSAFFGGIINLTLFIQTVKTYRPTSNRPSASSTFFRRAEPSKTTLSTSTNTTALSNQGIQVTVELQLDEISEKDGTGKHDDQELGARVV